MTKEKKEQLVKYLNRTKDMLSAPIPEKHRMNPISYHNFLKREIKIVEAQLEAHRLGDNVK